MEEQINGTTKRRRKERTGKYRRRATPVTQGGAALAGFNMGLCPIPRRRSRACRSRLRFAGQAYAWISNLRISNSCFKLTSHIRKVLRRGGYWIALIALLCCLLAVAGAVIGEGLKPVGMMRIALADKPEDEEETAVSAMAGETPEQTVLPGYENTKWGITAPDGSAVTDHTWEKHFEMVRESAKNGIRVRINGIDVDFPDQKPLMEQGRVLVPMRPVFEHVCVQCRVSWDGEAGVATVYDQKGRQVTFKPGELSYTVTNADGSVRLYPLDVPAAVVGGRVLLPLRALLETFSYKVDWYETHQRVDIQDSFPGWRKLMKPDEWKRALEEECLPCSLVREVS